MRNVLVIDLGGGTLDVSLLIIQGGMFLTQAMAGLCLYLNILKAFLLHAVACISIFFYLLFHYTLDTSILFESFIHRA